jgi:nucleotide-binding universal stress UspA family protein
MYRSILVPLDGSAFGEHALPFALSLARRAGAQLHLAHIHVPPVPILADANAHTRHSSLRRAHSACETTTLAD